jgi:hypothetical protein
MWNYPTPNHRYVLAKSFHWCVKDTAPYVDRNRLGFIALSEKAFFPGYTEAAHAIAFNITTGIVDDVLTAGPVGLLDIGQGAIVIWDVGGGEIGSFHGVCFHYDDAKVYAFTQSQSDYDTQEVDYMGLDDDILGQFQCNFYDSGWYTRYSLYSIPYDGEEKKQVFLTWHHFEIYPTEKRNFIAAHTCIESKYWPLNYYPMPAYGWGLDENGNQCSIVEITIPDYGEPAFETLYTGYDGENFKINSYPVLDYPGGYIGVSVAGYSNTLIVWTLTNVGKNILHLADFSDLNVREAINKIAEVSICYWKRPERDIGKFISRSNIVDTYTLENSEYKKDYLIKNLKAYIGVEVKNDLHPQYKFRYPATFNAEEGEALKIENRFVYPINGYTVAKIAGDWFSQIRRKITLNGFYLIELEELDKIELKLYNVDASPEEQIDSVLVKASYDDKTKMVILQIVELEGYPFKAIRFRPDYFAV